MKILFTVFGALVFIGFVYAVSLVVVLVVRGQGESKETSADGEDDGVQP